MKSFLLILIVVVIGGCKYKGGMGEGSTVNKPPSKISFINGRDSVVPDPIVYHIRVRPYGEGCSFWCVEFTNDNFITIETINKTFDLSRDYGYASNVILQLDLFRSESQAVSFAKQFTSYKKCIDYNSIIQKRFEKLVAYRIAHPVKPPEENPKILTCSPNAQTIVY